MRPFFLPTFPPQTLRPGEIAILSAVVLVRHGLPQGAAAGHHHKGRRPNSSLQSCLCQHVKDRRTLNIEHGTLNIENGAVFNLQGQKVTKAQKGVYIQNGKKVVLK